jgi:hypothetical protein
MRRRSTVGPPRDGRRPGPQRRTPGRHHRAATAIGQPPISQRPRTCCPRGAPRRRTLPADSGDRSNPVGAAAGRGGAAPRGRGLTLPSEDADEIVDQPQQVVELEREAKEVIPTPHRLVCCRLRQEIWRRGEDNDRNAAGGGLLAQPSQ